MRSATAKKFRPPLWGTLGLVVFVTLFCSAGFWQLGRAREKRAIFDAFEQNTDGESVLNPVADNEAGQYLYRRFTLTGRYVPQRQILLDNMVHDGRPGYQVLTPLRVDTTSVLVNRGWLPADRDRKVLPDVSVTDKIRTVTGRLYRLPRAGYELKPAASQANDAWPRRLSFPSAGEIGTQTGFPVHDYQLLLDPADTDGYVRDWHPAMMRPEKHLAYAIQWFMMAATLVIIYAGLTIRAVRRKR